MANNNFSKKIYSMFCLSAFKETYTSVGNKISPKCLSWGRNVRREISEECFTNSPDVSAKNKYSH